MGKQGECAITAHHTPAPLFSITTWTRFLRYLRYYALNQDGTWRKTRRVGEDSRRQVALWTPIENRAPIAYDSLLWCYMT